MYPASHKTVFVLDHGSYFHQSSKQQMEFDVFTKSRQPGFIPLAPIVKSLWTCTVEAAVEYCRIVWDIYPKDKLVRFIVSDTGVQFLNTWSQAEQSLTWVMHGLAQIGPPRNERAGHRDTGNANIMNGLNAAIEAMCQCSDIQHEKRTSLTENASKVLNRGRVICITNLRSNSYAKRLEECFSDALVQHNKLAASTDNLLQVHHCELVLIHTFPLTDETYITEKPKRDLLPILTSEIYTVRSGRQIATKVCQMALRHYNLSSTTVTGIPMKEEQNANSSANYDVELLHHAEAHTEIARTASHVRSVKEGADYETVTLKWCTPRTNAVELQYCTGMFRITPMDVNSRPSSCLTNFLLNGRAVMLEMPRKSGSKVLSHLLASHGGEIFIHTLGTSRSILEEPPSISEGCGGRVTDYRITDFGEFMKANRLAPSGIVNSISEVFPIERAKRQLERMTRYWPMVISDTTIFNMPQYMGPLISLVVQEKLKDDEVLECKKIIYQIVAMETRNEALPVPSSGSRGKGPKREEQYRIMWNELETFVRAHSLTDGHKKVLECLLECRKPNVEDTKSGLGKKVGEKSVAVKDEKVPEVETAWKVIEKYNKMTEREKGDFNKVELGVDASKGTGETPMLKKMRVSLEDLKGKSTSLSGPQSLLALWTNRMNLEHSKHHVEFAGRLAADSNIAKLYVSVSEALDT